MSNLVQWLWPKVTEPSGAEKATRLAYYAATILSVVFFFTAFLSIYAIQTTGADHRLDFVDAALFMVLGLCIKGRDPYAALLALCLCVLEAGYRLSAMMLPVWALLIVLFVSGVRGTFWLIAHPRPAAASEEDALPEAVLKPAGELAETSTRPAFFALSGRLDRRWYAIYMIVLAIVSVVGIALASMLLAAMGMNAQATTLLSGLLCLPFAFVAFMLTAQRCHDFDRSGWRALFLLLPGLGFLCFVAVPGSPAGNSYGPANP